MNLMHKAGIDLNLLTVFHAIMLERNITRAAARVGLTQPAVSHALGRLRLLLGDDLFVRVPGGMTPTPRAEAMAARVEKTLLEMASLFRGPEAFDPAASSRRFVIGLSDYATLVLLPPLLRLAGREAPRVTFLIKNASHGTGFSLLESGAVELIAGNFPTPPRHCAEEHLYREGFVCAGRADHPALQRPLTVKRYLACAHLQVSTAGEAHGYVDRVLDRKKVRRRVVVTVGHFLAAPHLLQGTDLIATEPGRLFSRRETGGMVRLVSPPFAIPAFAVGQVWHRRLEKDPGHQWLRDLVRRAALSAGE